MAAKGWELWTRATRHDAAYFIRSFSDKGTAQRYQRRLQGSHPDIQYMLKHRRVAASRHTYEARRAATRRLKRLAEVLKGS